MSDNKQDDDDIDHDVKRKRSIKAKEREDKVSYIFTNIQKRSMGPSIPNTTPYMK